MTAPVAPVVPFEAVTFDYWNTLARPDDSRFREHRLTGLHVAIVERGGDVTLDQVEEAASGLFDLFNEAWEQNRQFTSEHAVDAVLSNLSLTFDGTERHDVSEAFAHAIEDPPLLAPNVTETLDGLRDRGIRIGIICDVGMTPSVALRRYLERHEVLDRFDHWSFSDEVGVYKPHPEIFEHAMAGLGVSEPARVAHVGDLRRTDVAGAVEFGMTAVRYRAINDDDPDEGEPGHGVEAHHVIDDHSELEGLLGLT